MKLFILLISFFHLPSFAGQDRGNGGQSIYIGDNAFLRDIVEQSNCLWRSGTRILNTNPKVKDVLDTLSESHWLFSHRAYEEIKSLKFCMTKRRLPPLSYNNTDDLYIFTNQNFDQPAINDGGIIFIDLNIFEDMNEIHQAFILIHEVLHEFFYQNEARSKREPRLRELIMNLHDFYINGIDAESMKIALEMARMPYLRLQIDNFDKDKYLKVFNHLPLNFRESFEVLDHFYLQNNVSDFYSNKFKEGLKKIEDNILGMDSWSDENILTYQKRLKPSLFYLRTGGYKKDIRGRMAIDNSVFHRLQSKLIHKGKIEEKFIQIFNFLNNDLWFENLLYYQATYQYLTFLKIAGDINYYPNFSLDKMVMLNSEEINDLIREVVFGLRFYNRNELNFEELLQTVLKVLDKGKTLIVNEAKKDFFSSRSKYRKKALLSSVPELWKLVDLSSLISNFFFKPIEGIEALIRADKYEFLFQADEVFTTILELKWVDERNGSLVSFGSSNRRRVTEYLFSYDISLAKYEKMINVICIYLDENERNIIKAKLINKINSIDISNLTKPNLSHSKKKFKAFIKSALRITDKL